MSTKHLNRECTLTIYLNTTIIIYFAFFLELEKLPSVLSNVAVKQATEQASKNPVIESPEDLEKWLDDFLDG